MSVGQTAEPQAIAEPSAQTGFSAELMDFEPVAPAIASPAVSPPAPTEAAPTPAAQPAAQPPAQAAAPQFSEELLLAAEAFGLDRDVVASSFPNPVALTQALRAMSTASMRYASRAAQPEPPAPAVQPPARAPAQPAQPAGEAAAAAAAQAIQKFKIEVQEDEIDERALALLNGLNDHYHAVAERQQQEIQAAARVAREAAEYRQMLEDERLEIEADRFFDGLGDGFVGVFGKGPAADLPPNSAELRSRSEVYGQAMTIAEGLMARGKQIPPMRDLLKMAVGLSHFDKAQQLAVQQVASQVSQRRTQAVSRPSARPTEAASTADERAASVAVKWFQDRGIPVSAGADYLAELAD